ncbi:MAG: hypothetical protein E7107_05580 [Prevotella sp.]|nr:hypothetical protein [Prevotella sp.]
MDENKKAEYTKGMFAGATFNNSVVVGIAESGSTVSYEAPNKKMKDDGDDNLQKKGKKAIMEYVGRLRPLVKEQYQERYDQIWEGILEISQVKAVIYNKGKQQDTTFNRNLLAQLIHQVEIIYLSSANNALMTTYLEPERGADHPVRQKLGEVPDKDIKNAVEDYMKKHLE